MTKSVCIDCIWKKSCQKLERINSIDDSRKSPVYINDVFEIIIYKCSTKNYDRSYKIGGDKEDKRHGMYYCTDCCAMHHERSSIGRSHKRILSDRIP